MSFSLIFFTRTMTTLESLDERVLRFQSDPAVEPFLAIANDLATWQYEHVPSLRRWWDHRGQHPPFDHLDDLPAVPTDAFRSTRFHDPERVPLRTFLTSGTTSGARGAHLRSTLRAYDHGARLHFRSAVQPPGRAQWPALALDAARHPESSLSYMIDLLAADDHASVHWLLTDEGLDPRLLQTHLTPDHPVVLFGTAFAFAELLQMQHAPLHPDSLLLETGGFKGRHAEVDRATFHARLAAHVHLDPARIRSEYSMTELSSQLYTLPGERRFLPPHWLHVSTADPDTLRPLPPGSEGLLRFVDLANTDTVLAVQTSDMGRVDVDGLVNLLGRDPRATPRGCSLAVEELLALQSMK